MALGGAAPGGAPRGAPTTGASLPLEPPPGAGPLEAGEASVLTSGAASRCATSGGGMASLEDPAR
eukprot:1898130-Alexandrium_andersonii.AAC.1